MNTLDKKMQSTTDWLSSVLKGEAAAVDYEIQDGGKFVLFRASQTMAPISDRDLRNLIHAEISRRFQGIDAKWMLVLLDARPDVIDEIDSIIGVDY